MLYYKVGTCIYYDQTELLPYKMVRSTCRLPKEVIAQIYIWITKLWLWFVFSPC